MRAHRSRNAHTLNRTSPIMIRFFSIAIHHTWYQISNTWHTSEGSHVILLYRPWQNNMNHLPSNKCLISWYQISQQIVKRYYTRRSCCISHSVLYGRHFSLLMYIRGYHVDSISNGKTCRQGSFRNAPCRQRDLRVMEERTTVPMNNRATVYGGLRKSGMTCTFWSVGCRGIVRTSRIGLIEAWAFEDDRTRIEQSSHLCSTGRAGTQRFFTHTLKHFKIQITGFAVVIIEWHVMFPHRVVILPERRRTGLTHSAFQRVPFRWYIHMIPQVRRVR